MAIISAFADEIDQSLAVQMDVCEQHGIRHIDVRSIDGTNVSAMTDEQVRTHKKQMDDRGFAVPCIGSPLGKIKIDGDLQAHLDLTKRCCEVAHGFDSKYIRIFSFYGPSTGGSVMDHRAKVMEMLAKMVAIGQDAGVVMLHENEKGIYGAGPEGVKDIFATVGSDSFQGIFDPSNYIEEGIDPLADGWQQGLAELTHYFHIKDKARREDKTCVPAGEGSGHIPEILADAKARGFDGYLTLEPHMSNAGQFAGFSGPDKFARAVAGLKGICDQVGLRYQ